MAEPLNGILVLNKPAGISSARSLTKIKYLFPRDGRPKIGHAGTLDPFAMGVLLVLLGKSTKRCEELMGQEKRYRTTIKLGATTPTLDPTWEESEVVDAGTGVEIPSREMVEAVLQGFVGTIMQVPPAFSALKLSGRPSYEMAKRGQEVELEARPVQIYEMSLVRYAYPELEIETRCGRGTYIRSLARDIAAKLGTLGYVKALSRTAVGAYTIEQGCGLDEMTMETLVAGLRE
jgi:tRNA pseudouridine55 synthase